MEKIMIDVTEYKVLESELIDKYNELNCSFREDETMKEIYDQYFTPLQISKYMSSFYSESRKKKIDVLDPCAGKGSLVVGFLLNVLKWEKRPNVINFTLIEIDSSLNDYIDKVFEVITMIFSTTNIRINYNINNSDFLLSSTINQIESAHGFSDYIIMNPPYKKLKSYSKHKKELHNIGIDATNYYAAFISVSKRLLKKNGELVSITPRSFCNGPHFQAFRSDIMSDLTLKNVHLFESRKAIFKKDKVRQENVITHFVKKKYKNVVKVNVHFSDKENVSETISQVRKFDEIVYPSDNTYTIRLAKEENNEIISKIESLGFSLGEIGLQASTGPIVDFREDDGVLNNEFCSKSKPIIFVEHLIDRKVDWPKANVKKYNYIDTNEGNKNRLRPIGNYVLVKRMTAKEEKRRIVSSLLEASNYDYDYIGFDNKLNYIHANKGSIPIEIARGLNIYLNSTIVDLYFRTFSGHTQVNVSDLEVLHYPSLDKIIEIGSCVELIVSGQNDIDQVINDVLFSERK